jgi:hypothetical protein
MGYSQSKTKSEQYAETYLTQQFSGTCDVTCDNSIDNLTIDIINSTVGGDVKVSQSCSTNANCLISSNMDATSDVLFTALNSSNAANAGNILNMIFGFPSVERSSSKSRQSIRTSINQSDNQTCKLSSYNQMNNVTIFAANSTIGGDISVSQTGSTQGQCQLSNSMSAAAYASGQANNNASSGKDKKTEKFSAKSGKIKIFTYFILGIVVIVIVGIIAKIIAGRSQTSEMTVQELKTAQMRALAGCPGGVKPVADPATGQAYIDPKTKRHICPPPPMFPPSGPGSSGGGSSTSGTPAVKSPSSTVTSSPPIAPPPLPPRPIPSISGTSPSVSK